MSLTRLGSELHLPAPPPSPIPTAKGSRSAANAVLSEYLARNLKIPDLSLPDPFVPIDAHDGDQMLPLIRYPLLVSGDSATMDLFLTSIREVGAFLISDHEILGEEEFKLLVEETDRVIGNLPRNLGEIARVRHGPERIIMEWEREYVEDERCGTFRKKMEDVANRLDAFVQQLCNIFAQNMSKQQLVQDRIQRKESVLGLYTYKQSNDMDLNAHLPAEENSKLCDYTMCIILPLTRSQFFVESANGPVYFDAGSDTVIVTLGKRVEEWSMGELKSVTGEVIYEPEELTSQPSCYVELKCITLDLNLASDKGSHIISVRDQILIGYRCVDREYFLCEGLGYKDVLFAVRERRENIQ